LLGSRSGYNGNGAYSGNGAQVPGLQVEATPDSRFFEPSEVHGSLEPHGWDRVRHAVHSAAVVDVITHKPGQEHDMKHAIEEVSVQMASNATEHKHRRRASLHMKEHHSMFRHAATVDLKNIPREYKWLAMMAKLKDFDEAMHLLFPLSFIVYCVFMLNSVQMYEGYASQGVHRAA